VVSIATSWLGQQRQTREQRRAREKTELQALCKQFIEDASILHVDAEHDATEIPKLIDIYATLNRIRVLSPPEVIVEADNGSRRITDTVVNENAHFPDQRVDQPRISRFAALLQRSMP